MKKQFLRLAALTAVLSLSLGNISAGAVTFDHLDSNTAVAGSSFAIHNYMESNENGAEMIAAALNNLNGEQPQVAVNEGVATSGKNRYETLDEVAYEEPKDGIVKAEGFLNVRRRPSTNSEQVESLFRGAEITVIGEKKVNGMIWYKVQLGEIEGYVLGTFVVFNEEAEEFRQIVAEEEKANSALPESFTLPEGDDFSRLSEEDREKLEALAREIDWVLRIDVPEQRDAENDDLLHSVYLYLLEEYQILLEIAYENQLKETYYQAADDIHRVELNRKELEEIMIEKALNAPEEPETEPPTEPVVPEQPVEPAPQPPVEQPTAPAPPPTEPAPQPVEPQPTEPAPQPTEPAPQPTEPAPQPTEPAPQPTDPAPVPEAQNPLGTQIAQFAASWVGRIPYVYGGNMFYEGGGVDCSHFTYNVYLHFGLVGGYVNSGGQTGWGRPVDISDIQPGDLVCYPGHVAIYYGNGQIVHAPAPGRYIEYGSLYVGTIVAIRRLY